MQLKIISLNVAGINGKRKQLLLQRFLEIHKPDILFLCETHLKTRIPSFPGYTLFHQNRLNSNGGGVAILIKNKFRAFQTAVPDGIDFECCCVKLLTQCDFILLASVYIPNQGVDMSQLFLIDHTYSLIGGDLNARMPTNGDIINQNGRSLGEITFTDGWSLITPIDKTCFRSINGSTIDYFIARNIHTSTCTTSTSFVDHSPIHITCNLSPVQNNIDDEQINLAATELNIVVTNTLQRMVPKSYGRPFIKPSTALNKLCALKCKLCRHLRQPGISERRFNEITAQKRIIEISIRNMLTSECNETYKRSIGAIHPGANMFPELKRLCGLGKKVPMPSQFFTDETKSTTINDPKTVADELATRFEMNNLLPNGIQSRNEDAVIDSVRTVTESEFKIQFNHQIISNIVSNDQLKSINDSLPLESRGYLTSTEELRSIIQQRPGKKSCGIDGISTFAIKHLSNQFFQFLVILFNHCIANSIFPAIWKTALIKPIPKIGRDSSIISNYRPISQLSAISKIFEKVIEKRLRGHLNTLHLWDPFQFGFMPGRSTIHALATIQGQISSQLNNGFASILVLLDIKAAFDSVWHGALIHKMLVMNVPLGIIRIIASYLQNREYIVEVNGHHSRTIFPNAGTPQGGVLSAVLFNILIIDIPNFVGILRLNFADDTALAMSTKNLLLDKYRLQNAMDSIADYFQSWKITICAEKTEVLPIVGSCRDTNQRLRKQCRELRLSINNSPIEPVSRAKYLGVVFAKNARFDRHIDHVIAKTNTAMALTRGIINRRTISHSVRRLIYKCIVNPIMTYASQMWLNPSFISSHQVERIRIAERKCLRSASDIYFNDDVTKYINSQKLYDWFADKRIDVRMCGLIISFYDRCIESDDPQINGICIINNNGGKYEPPNIIHTFNDSNNLFVNDKLLIFNRHRYRDSNLIVYSIAQ